MLRAHARLVHRLVLSADVVLAAVVYAALVALPELREAEVGGDALVGLLIPGLVSSLAWPLVLEPFGLYGSQRRRNLYQVLARLLAAGTITAGLVALAVVALAAPVAPIFPLAVVGAQLAALATTRLIALVGLRIVRRRGHNFRNVLIVGSGSRARHVLHVVERHREWGLRVVGFVDEGDVPQDPRLATEKVHKLVDLPAILRDTVIDKVIVACPRSMLDQIGPVVSVCASAGVPLMVLSDIFGDYLPPPRVTRFGSLAALSFAPVHHSHSMLLVKRAIDVIGSAALLLASLPVLAVAAVAIRVSSPGPVFFRQARCGQSGRHFQMVKLRTMCVDAEQQKSALMGLNEMDGPVFKIRNDPRVTPVGRFLRRWSIDELPQFWNVLKGDMSLVGPRPPVPTEVAQYQTFDRRRLSMRPGITCLWQVSGRNAIGFDDWVKLDLEYIDTWSLLNDFKILLKTVPAALRGTGS